VAAQRARLQRFVRRYVLDREEAEDILQDVFYELVDAYRLTKPIEQVGAWLYRVARNRIIDRFRKRKHAPLLEENGLMKMAKRCAGMIYYLQPRMDLKQRSHAKC